MSIEIEIVDSQVHATRNLDVFERFQENGPSGAVFLGKRERHAPSVAQLPKLWHGEVSAGPDVFKN